MRQINDAGRALIQSFEGKRNVGYLPTPNDVPTAGYGHTGPDVDLGVEYSDDQIEQWFEQDIAWAERAVEQHVTVGLTDNQFAALVSICFNIGLENFINSTLLRDLNSGNYGDASDQFLVWDRQRGQTLPGLRRRREAERGLFNA
jgi:lysozyme